MSISYRAGLVEVPRKVEESVVPSSAYASVRSMLVTCLPLELLLP